MKMARNKAKIKYIKEALGKAKVKEIKISWNDYAPMCPRCGSMDVEKYYPGKLWTYCPNCGQKVKNAKSKMEETDMKNKVKIASLNPGEIFKIDKYDFIVLEQSEGYTAAISKDFMAENKVFANNTRNYNESSLKEFIETELQPIIENAVGTDNLIEHEVDLTSVDMQNEFGKCRCKIRPLTFDEARKYNDLLVNRDLDDYWWTCTPWSTAERGWKYSITVVSPSGYVDNFICGRNRGVRPFCIFSSSIFESED